MLPWSSVVRCRAAHALVAGLLLAAPLAAVLLIAAPLAAEWKAGVSKSLITPEAPMWMSGYAARNRPAQGKQTELWAKALALVDAKDRRVVLVTLDLVGIDRQFAHRVCDALAQRHGLPREAIALATSHTHSGPVVGTTLHTMYFLDEAQQERVTAYTRQLEEKIVAVVGEALERLEPARLTWGRGQATFAVNRRNNAEPRAEELRRAGRLVGPVDYDVPVLAVRDGEDRLKAVVCGYACHATTLDGYDWSGDWPGYAQIELEARRPGAVALVWAGCGADQNPLPRRRPELAECYGRQLAVAMERVLDGVMTPLPAELRPQWGQVDLPYAKLPTREELKQATESANRYEAQRARKLLADWDRDGKLSPTYPYPVQTWRVGGDQGVLWTFLGGEVVVDYALALKAELGPATWIVAYANDVMAYIPSRRVLGEGGYEGGGAMVYYGLPSPWAPEVEQLVVNEVLRQARTQP